MLAELSIKNFAIIESLSISFEKGLTVLSGETGAGKSIIIDAIHLLVGGRGSAEFVRYGENKAEIEGLFLLEDVHPCYDKVKEFGIDATEGMVVLRRDILSNGKSVCRINGKLVTISILREVGRTLMDIHGQHEHQELMNSELHLSLLDQYGGEVVDEALTEYRDIYKQYTELKRKLKELSENEQEMAHRLDLLLFQHKEIEKANLVIDEDIQLLQERKNISNFESIFEGLNKSYEALSGDQKGLDWLGHAMGHTEDISEINDSLKEIHETISNSYYLLEETLYKIRQQLDALEFDPNKLDLIESRLNEIGHLKKKYGQTVGDIIEYAAKIEEEIEKIQNRDHHVDNIKKDLTSVTDDLSLEAKNLTSIRKKFAVELIQAIHRELRELYMEKTVFDIYFKQVKGSYEDPLLDGENVKYTLNGNDEIEFYISTNPGEPMKPLAKVASGGELSRIMLAMKSIFSKHQGITSIIFDEVDTGVSGRVAQSIAEKIHRVSIDSQVLCISHLPQVAAMADTHLFIAKQSEDGRTKTSVTPLNEEEKIKEIGRMISGVEITDLTKEHAKELLGFATKIKQN
ncbi:DNA repair protein RecN [Bacillus luteolus]|uniref:DNA repair protein RecN n=1 Tax=Litchfieldia luteola TaxID=682179 RepID=A0ABR9QPK7_9BACI|nr:DNA repair protein RecN [Cytobacillus luteolus]MBE4910440.1 DNA repair protein RecN [Cytobacillus luteolus]MBP1941984.1 DNA repair protein RecN (Recombination protein N) [Cytobacillus luteolus]